MSISMQRSLLFLLMTAFSANSLSADITIYRWVDENNIVHFSQNQPKTGNFSQLSAKKMSAQKIKAAYLAKQEMAAQREEEAKAESIKDDEKVQCVTARQNLKTLQDFDNIQYKTNTGKVKLLTAKEKKAQLAFNKKQIELYCVD